MKIEVKMRCFFHSLLLWKTRVALNLHVQSFYRYLCSHGINFEQFLLFVFICQKFDSNFWMFLFDRKTTISIQIELVSNKLLDGLSNLNFFLKIITCHCECVDRMQCIISKLNVFCIRQFKQFCRLCSQWYLCRFKSLFISNGAAAISNLMLDIFHRHS